MTEPVLLLNHPAYRPLPTWIANTVNREIMTHRFRAAAIDRALVTRLTKRIDVSELGLLQRDASGQIRDAARVDGSCRRHPGRDDDDPAVLGVSAAPQLLNSVIEEKMSRIGEVLIGSVTPFELMMGKLIGCVGVSLLLAAVYVAGGAAGAMHGLRRRAAHPTSPG